MSEINTAKHRTNQIESSNSLTRFLPNLDEVMFKIKNPLKNQGFNWCRQRDSNSRPTDYKSSKLLIPHNINLLFLNKKSLAGKGFKQFFKILNTFKLRVGIASCMYFTHSALT